MAVALSQMDHQEFSGEAFTSLPIDHGEILESCSFVRCSFEGAWLESVETKSCLFEECSFVNAQMNGSGHCSSSFLNCDFSRAALFGTHFTECRLVGSNLASADLTALRVQGGDWSYCILRLQKLDRTNFSNVKLAGADLYGCSLRNCDFSKANLAGANLQQCDLRASDLRSADLTDTDLKTAKLKDARITVDIAILFAMSHGMLVE
jgi:fluoroquinolone resistance protein